MFSYLFNKQGGIIPFLGAVKALGFPHYFLHSMGVLCSCTETIATPSPRLSSPQATSIHQEIRWGTPVYLNSDLAKMPFETIDLVKSF